MNVVEVDFPSNRRVATRSTEVNSGFNSRPGLIRGRLQGSATMAVAAK
jgi:hypothetical protein